MSLKTLKIGLRLGNRIIEQTSTRLTAGTFLNQGTHHFFSRVSSLSTPCNMIAKDDLIVHVQRGLGKDMMTISFKYFTDNNQLKQFNLLRKSSEPLSACLERIKLNLKKIDSSKEKKSVNQKDVPDKEVQVRIICDGSFIDPNATDNLDAWVEGRTLDLNGKSYSIKTDSPLVESIRLPNNIMKGFIVVPLVNLKNCAIENCRFAWHRRISLKERAELLASKTTPNEEMADKLESDGHSHWLKVAEGLSYSPSSEDVAHYLRATCYPKQGLTEGLEASTISESPVELGPTSCPFEKRHSHTIDYLPNTFDVRVVTYNILADLYADSDYSRTVLFGYCPSYALEIDYRRQLLLKELMGYHADIICLQEVDKKEFSRTYHPFFSLTGNYGGIFDTKGGQVAEGTATFFRREKFELVETHRTLLSRLIDTSETNSSDSTQSASQQDETHPILGNLESEIATKCLSKFDSFRKVIKSNEALAQRFLNRHTIVQTSLLKLKTKLDKYIIVANTHLYFAPDADHIRLLQGSICTKYLEFLKDHYRSSLGTDDIALLLCGDMNSVPECGLYRLLTTGSVSRDLPDWSSNEEEVVRDLDVETDLRFQPAYKNISYTNYTKDFNGCLDYIYYECNKLLCEGTVPLPDSEDVIAIGGIPSDVFPSDHLALIANLRYLVE